MQGPRRQRTSRWRSRRAFEETQKSNAKQCKATCDLWATPLSGYHIADGRENKDETEAAVAGAVSLQSGSHTALDTKVK